MVKNKTKIWESNLSQLFPLLDCNSWQHEDQRTRRWQRHSKTTAISILCSKQGASLFFPMFKCSTFSFPLYAHVCITIRPMV